ncbi:hypothetical protein GGS21DRAFT_486230 [Xylaria nigripes]|nr:hypothetical protein GGS21DRAFT_486230 [Xylaria nigripes]
MLQSKGTKEGVTISDAYDRIVTSEQSQLRLRNDWPTSPSTEMTIDALGSSSIKHSKLPESTGVRRKVSQIKRNTRSIKHSTVRPECATRQINQRRESIFAGGNQDEFEADVENENRVEVEAEADDDDGWVFGWRYIQDREAFRRLNVAYEASYVEYYNLKRYENTDSLGELKVYIARSVVNSEEDERPQLQHKASTICR